MLAASLRQRAQLDWSEPGEPAPKPRLRLLAGELSHVAEAVRRHLRPPLKVSPAPAPKLVMLLPGFGASPKTMRTMAITLERAGHEVKDWHLGLNLGPSEENFALWRLNAGPPV